MPHPTAKPQPGAGPPPPDTRSRRRPRWELLAVPLALLAGPWFVGSCEATLPWRNVMASLGVHRPEDYSATVALAAVLIALLIVLRLYRKPLA